MGPPGQEFHMLMHIGIWSFQFLPQGSTNYIFSEPYFLASILGKKQKKCALRKQREPSFFGDITPVHIAGRRLVLGTLQFQILSIIMPIRVKEYQKSYSQKPSRIKKKKRISGVPMEQGIV